MSQLTTLVIAGCENVTDTFLLTCFVPDIYGHWSVLENESSSSAVHYPCTAAVTSNKLCHSVALSCPHKCSVDYNSHYADAAELLAFSTDSVVCRSMASPVEVGNSVQECHQSAPSCDVMNQSTTKYCNRKTCDNDKWTTVSYKLEHLDMSGCWKVSDLSIRYVIVCVHILLLVHGNCSVLIRDAVFQYDMK